MLNFCINACFFPGNSSNIVLNIGCNFFRVDKAHKSVNIYVTFNDSNMTYYVTTVAISCGFWCWWGALCHAMQISIANFVTHFYSSLKVGCCTDACLAQLLQSLENKNVKTFSSSRTIFRGETRVTFFIFYKMLNSIEPAVSQVNWVFNPHFVRWWGCEFSTHMSLLDRCRNF